MDSSLAKPAGSSLAKTDPLQRLLKAYIANRSPRTIETYNRALEAFAKFRLGSVKAAVADLLKSHGHANTVALAYVDHMRSAKLAPATINLRIAAVRSLIAVAKMLDLCNWDIQVEGVKSQTYRDTAGPGLDGLRAMFAEAAKQAPKKAARDAALLRIFYDNGLRRAEVFGLDVSDFDLEKGTVKVMGKGRTEKETLTLPEKAAAAIAAWMKFRGDAPGPMFTSMAYRLSGSTRLTGNGVWDIIKTLGKKAGINTHPHGLRHTAITTAIDKTKDMRAVQMFSRHKNMSVIERYDDNAKDRAGGVARAVSEEL